jgi:DNA repair protein RecN (Recombination protein N)
MLRFIGVRHLAVIDHLEVEVEPGLNLITGETGAGKSILIEALTLLAGGRASADLVRTGEDTATIQAIFERPDGREVIVRREISAQGRGRAFIDDALATTAALRELGAELLDLHVQHEHQALLDAATHIDQLDAWMGESDLRARVADAFAAWRTAAAQLDRTQLDDREKQARIEIASFQLQEIDKVAPSAGEDERLAAERTVLANADRLSRLSSEAYAALYEGETSALVALSTVWKRLGELASIDPRFADYVEQRTAIKSSLEDLAFFLRSYAQDLDASPDRLQTVEDRLAAVERLKRKFGPTLDEVLARRAALQEDLASLGASEERAHALEEEERAARERFEREAAVLSRQRQTSARALSDALASALAELAMPKCRVDVRVARIAAVNDWTRAGIDRVEIFLSPNPGEELRPLARIASGGELSRVMLALRTLTTADGDARTLVFDEVDAGIGGAAADAVGARLQMLARTHQVLCITHLPQIAARAATHFRIAKQVQGSRTTSVMTRLDRDEREMEIARMIAGAEVSPKVLASARELLRTRGESEQDAKGETVTAAKAKGRKRGA